MTSWENYEDFLEKLGVGLLLRKLATLGTPIVEVCKKLVAKFYFVEMETSPEFLHLKLLRLLKKMENGTSVEPPPSSIGLSN